MRSLWLRFQRWAAGQLVRDFALTAVGHIDGPVRQIIPMRDYYIALTDRNVFMIYHDDFYGRPNIRRVA